MISCNGPANEECQLKMRVGSLYATLVRVAVVAFPTQNFHHLSFDRDLIWLMTSRSELSKWTIRFSCAINSIQKDYIMICNNRQGNHDMAFFKSDKKSGRFPLFTLAEMWS